MLLHDVRKIIAQMKRDPSISEVVPRVGTTVRSTLLWMLLSELFLVLQVLPVKYFTEELTKPSPNLQTLVLIGGSFAVLYKIGQKVRLRMDYHRQDTFWATWALWWGYGNRQLLRQSNDFHAQHSTGERESLVGKNVSRFQNLFDEALFNTFPVLLRILFTSLLMFFISWQIGLLALATLFLYSLAIVLVERRMTESRESYQAQLRAVENNGSEINRNWRTIRLLGLEEEFANHNDTLLQGFWNDERSRHHRYLRFYTKQDDILNNSRALLYIGAGLLVWHAIANDNPALSIGSVILAVTWMERAYSNFGRLTDFQRQLNVGKKALEELALFIQKVPTIQSPESPKQPDHTDGAVRFDRVTFAYPDAPEEHAICSLSLDVAANSSVALVGASGCGKSTLMSLLLREYDPTDGSIAVDGVDLRDYDYRSYRQNTVTAVLQQVELFDRSVADNIRLGRPDASMDDVIEAAKQAGAHEFIVELKDGYDALIGENGLRLSGGQRQRLAIARALIMKPRVLILDEATSALDPLSQAAVQRTIDSLIENRVCTIFIIAHRLSTVRGADNVVVMNAGQIVDQGPHEILREESPLYKEMCEIELAD